MKKGILVVFSLILIGGLVSWGFYQLSAPGRVLAAEKTPTPEQKVPALLPTVTPTAATIPGTATPAMTFTNRKWIWVSTKMNNDQVFSPKKAGAFSITFGEDGSVRGTTDCNNFAGKYNLSGNQLSFGALASTKMFCEGSQEGEFLAALGQIDRFLVDETKNQLVLLIKMDSGAMIFQ